MLHGFTGNPQSMRGLAEALADAGLTVELPLLPGHGTAVEDMVPTRWEDWSAAADEAYVELAARCESGGGRGAVDGGHASACWLAERHPEIAGAGSGQPADRAARRRLPPTPSRHCIDGGDRDRPGHRLGHRPARRGRDRPTPGCRCGPPSRSSRGPGGGGRARAGQLPGPVVLQSRGPRGAPGSGDLWSSAVERPVERVVLERSFHVATLDYDKDEIEARTVAFVTAVPAGLSARAAGHREAGPDAEPRRRGPRGPTGPAAADRRRARPASPASWRTVLAHAADVAALDLAGVPPTATRCRCERAAARRAPAGPRPRPRCWPARPDGGGRPVPGAPHRRGGPVSDRRGALAGRACARGSARPVGGRGGAGRRGGRATARRTPS